MKVGSNYGPTIYVNIQAQKHACQQVLWLFDKDEYLTEAGTMNIFLVVKRKNGGMLCQLALKIFFLYLSGESLSNLVVSF